MGVVYMRVKTYDFRAFCRGELIRTNHSGLWEWILTQFESPCIEIETEEGRFILIPMYIYGLAPPPFFVQVPVVEDESDAREVRRAFTA
ncbi:hypothetical protein [Alicyclobacillus ferrooxydans]|uniref:Uncharacterized protein n=1 Tax=Alicyclobacillus ferrooxydans TaxID=471514 RepID=A0A0P9ENW0_9BACL|nr:hypothetical protein [Alicyclobacillus ferrooxydans]KPV45152.1 hypothetical protein AN477_04020 [Alicyclobacillus ferrooxydans]